MARRPVTLLLAYLLLVASTPGTGARTARANAGLVPGQMPPESLPFEPVRKRVEALVAGGKAPSMAVAVARGGRIVWEQGFGMADRERRRPATPDTIYFLASVAKSMTATAVMILVDRGKILLDEPAATYLDEGLLRVYRGDAKDVTVRSLLTMTSGVPHLYRFYWNDEREPVPDDVEMLRRFAFVAFEPGRHFLYSNLSFGILQRVVERASGKPFGRFCDDEIFRPLGMRHTALEPRRGLDAGLARVYAPDFEGPLPWRSMQPAGGAGFYSSAHDLALFGLAMTGTPAAARRRVVSTEAVARMRDSGRAGFYGLGWWKDFASAKYEVMIADGLAWGGGATVMVAPEAGVVAVATVSGPTEANLTTFVAGDLLAAALPGYVSPRESWAAAVPPPDQRSEPLRPEGDWLGTFSGVVTTPQGPVPTRLEISRDGGVRMKIGEGEWRPLETPTVTGGLLEGSADVRLPEGAAPGPHRVGVKLRLSKGGLAGYVFAESTGRRGGYGLPFFVELRVLRPSTSPGVTGRGRGVRLGPAAAPSLHSHYSHRRRPPRVRRPLRIVSRVVPAPPPVAGAPRTGGEMGRG